MSKTLPHIQEFYEWCAEEDINEDVMYKIAGWLGSEIYSPSLYTESQVSKTMDFRIISNVKGIEYFINTVDGLLTIRIEEKVK